ncbi:MAG TPA: chemotaxis protein CheA, partial [Desulfosarcina sp.]|nr:chemotaxis protein CheA [Desulfosarcina sp.]
DSADAVRIDAFLQQRVAAGVDRIKALFPNAEALNAIDTAIVCNGPDENNETVSGGDPAPDEQIPVDGVSENEPAMETELTLALSDDMDVDSESDAKAAPLLQETDNSLLEDFADETREHLEELESSLLRLESDPGNRELLNTIFRSMHTIKGASEYLGFERIARLSHRLENLLDLFREGTLTADKVAVDLLIDARDRIGELVVQVEKTGQETAPIEDLLERVAAISSGTAEVGSGSEAATVYEGEADAELFDIFMEQLAGGIVQLMGTAARMAEMTAVGQAAAEMVEQVDRLTATANYMGYDALAAVYGEMLDGLAAFAPEADSADAVRIDAFLQQRVAAGVDRIKALFPNAEALNAIDTAGLAVAAATEAGPAAEQPTAPDTATTADIDALLAGLPAIDEGERESLLSRTLDATFSSMQNGIDEADHASAAHMDTDPMARQFSSAADADDWDRLPFEAGEGGEASPSSVDDFSAYSADAEKIGDHPLRVDAHAAGAGSTGDIDQWTKAPEMFLAESEIFEPETETPIPKLDLNPKTPESPAAVEDAESEAHFTARGAIRKSIRVDADKVDELMNQVGELVVNRSSFAQLFLEMRELSHYFSRRFPMDKTDLRMISDLTGRLNDATTVLGRVSSELQEQVMKVRMLPISRLFNRYPRLVHDLLRDSDKKIQLQFRGEETELDRMVIEQLADPMIHIIRNAVDHGIEPRGDRRRKGKAEKGSLVLEAYHEGSNVIIEVTDDGQGIDLSRIRQKAIEKGLATREALEGMDQKSLVDMIMLPGFSTADAVSHTSGRGVGMDVVKRNIEKINGSLEIDTRQDVGTRFRIKIPLTLAIIPALMIRCAGSHFTVPLGAVQETLRIDQGEIFTVDGSEVMHLHEEPLPLVRLSELLSMKPAAEAGGKKRLFVVVVKSASGRTGFIVDAFLGRQEVVIKPLEDYLQEDSGFSGATILGDGSISLILNVDDLVTMAKDREAERKLAAAVL